MDDFLSVIADFSVPMALIGGFAVFRMAVTKIGDKLHKVIAAFFMALLGISTMAFHFNIAPGVIIDQRGAAVAVATLFGGPWVGATTAAAEMIYRAFLGGVAMWAGLLGIIGDFLASILTLYLLRTVVGAQSMRVHSLILLGLAVGTSEALSLLLIPPFKFGFEFFQCYGLPLFLLQIFSTMLYGGLLHFEESRLQALSLVENRNMALRRALHQVVGSLSTAMIHRDPSTAGHEQRVADISVAVGKVLGWNDERLEGLHLAAMAHDIGQIQTPAEILSRPRKLNPQEFELVKMHVESGYQILKDVEFPWPIAEIVYQHHENLDGTGYPRGLIGDQISPEARIIRVCDALEAMLSHRPFRRAYTVEQALKVLQEQSDVQLDSRIVNICIQIFTEQGFSFAATKNGIQR